MDLLPTEEQSEIVATVQAQLDSDFSLTGLAERDGEPCVIDSALWGRCAELGWFALGLAESDGGIGYGLVEETLLFEELGGHCTPGPFLATVLAAHVAAGADEAELTASVINGENRVALVEPESSEASVSSLRVTGQFRITDFGEADLGLVLGGPRAAVVDLSGIQPAAEPCIDALVPLATLSLDVVPLAALDDSSVALRATVLTAAELAGMARATAQQSTQYGMDREQFGRPVGSFQAVKHRCADMAVLADAAVQLTHLAALAVAGGHSDAGFQAESARVLAADAAVRNAEMNVQNHGGIGFTLEHTAHRYVTRSRVRANTAGNRRTHLASLLEQAAPS